MAIFNKQSALKLWLLAMAIFFVTFAGCKRTASREHALLMRADSALIANADTLAFNIICSITDTVSLTFNAADSALFAVLTNQALDRMDCIIDDSLAQYAVDYYLHNDADDDYHEGLAYYYMGHVLKKTNNPERITWYELADLKFNRYNDIRHILRYHFLAANNIAYTHETNSSVPEAICAYKRALEIAKFYGDWRYVLAEYSIICQCYSYLNSIDSTYLYFDSAFSVNNHTGWNVNVYNALSRVHVEHENYDKAIEYCDSAFSSFLKYGSDTITTNLLYAEAFIGKKQFAKALRIINSMQTSSNVYYELEKCRLLSDLYLASNNSDSTAKYMKQYQMLCDTVCVISTGNDYSKIAPPAKNGHTSIDNTFVVAVITSVFALLTVACVFVSKQQYRKRIQKTHDLEKKRKIDSALCEIKKELLSISCDDISINLKYKSSRDLLYRYFPDLIPNIKKLNSSLREEDVVCYLCKCVGLTHSQISSIMISISASGVNMRIRRMLEKLYVENNVELTNKFPYHLV